MRPSTSSTSRTPGSVSNWSSGQPPRRARLGVLSHCAAFSPLPSVSAAVAKTWASRTVRSDSAAVSRDLCVSRRVSVRCGMPIFGGDLRLAQIEPLGQQKERLGRQPFAHQLGQRAALLHRPAEHQLSTQNIGDCECGHGLPPDPVYAIWLIVNSHFYEINATLARLPKANASRCRAFDGAILARTNLHGSTTRCHPTFTPRSLDLAACLSAPCCAPPILKQRQLSNGSELSATPSANYIRAVASTIVPKQT